MVNGGVSGIFEVISALFGRKNVTQFTVDRPIDNHQIDDNGWRFSVVRYHLSVIR